jgi:hypothetical protein
MHTITDERKIGRGARLGKILVFGSLGFLVAGLVLALRMREVYYLWISLGCLVIALVGSTVGFAHMNRWVREPRADQALDQGLKGFDDRYRLYNYVLPAPHVLLSPAGLFVLTAMGQDGAIRYAGGKFRRGFSLGRIFRFLSDEGLGRPFAEGDNQVSALGQFLLQHGMEGVDIQNLIVFYHPRAQIEVTEPPRPVVDPRGLKRAIRSLPQGRLSSSLYGQLQELFEGGNG